MICWADIEVERLASTKSSLFVFRPGRKRSADENRAASGYHLTISLNEPRATGTLPTRNPFY
jgi:hypothetical protein